jgi:hypothetical protein
VVQLLTSPKERERRGQIGRARMGSSGAITAIAQEVQNWLGASLRG